MSGTYGAVREAWLGRAQARLGEEREGCQSCQPVCEVGAGHPRGQAGRRAVAEGAVLENTRAQGQVDRVTLKGSWVRVV